MRMMNSSRVGQDFIIIEKQISWLNLYSNVLILGCLVLSDHTSNQVSLSLYMTNNYMKLFGPGALIKTWFQLMDEWVGKLQSSVRIWRINNIQNQFSQIEIFLMNQEYFWSNHTFADQICTVCLITKNSVHYNSTLQHLFMNFERA